MQADPSPCEILVAVLLGLWPVIGLGLGTALMIASRFRWRLLCESVGVITLAICIGALVAKS